MKLTLRTRAFIYFALGILFMYVALLNADGKSIWNFTTILFAVFATLDFGMAIRLLRINRKIKKK
ncbi:protein of unknown function [Oceanobacillus limi]|uniref:DUF4305 domain-containing protein n=1 Tax=Oceanobacillus limi TaxID=930131 RepID=A0A1I0H234_9BACI|nr:YdiK family protein [Oceanobacillus limi]SET76887.1 protein of unknown function [Oceanobacillus limi]